MTDKDQDEKEAERRRDEALRRALSTPPKPHTKGEDEKRQEPKGGREKSQPRAGDKPVLD